LELKRPLWPPFYATALFLPRVRVKVTNRGEPIDRATLSAYIAEYGGPIGGVPSLTEGWDIAYFERWDTPWGPGETRKILVRIGGRNLPRAGTYVLRLDVSRWRPQESPVKELAWELEKHEDLDAAMKERAIEESRKTLRGLGINPDARREGGFRVVQMFEGTVGEYFRVEEVSSVLTFFLVVGTMLTAAATLVVGIASL
jgi:hypothetical protein